MKTSMREFRFLAIGMLLSMLLACDKQGQENVEPAMDIKFYKPESNVNPTQLQMTVKQGDIQLSAFGEFADDLSPAQIGAFYMGNMKDNTQAIMLLDAENESNFIYDIEPATGKKGKSLIEFERKAAGIFYLRIFHYDWENRLGTLLFETLIEKQGGDYKTTPSFEIEDPNFGARNKNAKAAKSFAAPVLNLDKFMVKKDQKSKEKAAEGFIESFDNFRNAELPEYLSYIKRAGATVAGVGAALSYLGVKASTIALGSTLAIGGGVVVVGAAAISIVTSDRFQNFLTNAGNRLDEYKQGIVEGFNESVEIFNGYQHTLAEHWNTITANFSGNLAALLDKFSTDDLIKLLSDLDDLPDSNGVLHFALSWNTATDIDLYVTDPQGETIYYSNSSSASGGYLDRDDTDGYGPENIFWRDNIPDGAYSVSVDYYGPSSGPPTNYTVSVGNGLGTIHTEAGVLSASGQSNQVFTIIKSGSNIVVQ